jgi:AcrR family transcriptional regulator
MTDARVLRSRRALGEALVDLLHAKPLDDITVREIAAASGVGYTTFFRHYPNKDALLDDVAAAEIDRLTRLTAPIYDAEDSAAACLTLCRYIEAHRALWSALLTGGAAGVVREELLRQGRKAATARPRRGRLPADLGVALAVAVIIELVAWWLRQPEPWSAEQVAEVLDQTVIAPVALR